MKDLKWCKVAFQTGRDTLFLCAVVAAPTVSSSFNSCDYVVCLFLFITKPNWYLYTLLQSSLFWKKYMLHFCAKKNAKPVSSKEKKTCARETYFLIVVETSPKKEIFFQYLLQVQRLERDLHFQPKSPWGSGREYNLEAWQDRGKYVLPQKGFFLSDHCCLTKFLSKSIHNKSKEKSKVMFV